MVATIGDGSATSYTVTHNFNTKDVQVSVREVATDAIVMPDVTCATVNSVNTIFATAPATGSYVISIVG